MNTTLSSSLPALLSQEESLVLLRERFSSELEKMGTRPKKVKPLMSMPQHLAIQTQHPLQQKRFKSVLVVILGE
ncbi:hypothetical protein [Vibrio parahaemolyticus]|uniref:hypothetical protein n=1 Tax=Vibrio parahaemolyticus TaxID=670 RepID=UPI0004133C8E|nr:hypothetical protein [Vibrio parahaemolyticus]MBE4079843.1 hypothetical protein [Vibrio parahaemolyticus]HCH5089025.1 hypothetical protein [Vibrio parahaemolyticus]